MIFKDLPSDFKGRVEVVSCFCECQGKILLLHRQNHKQYGNTWGPPAGKINAGETALEAIVRELGEESSLVVDAGQFKYFGKYYLRYPEYDFTFHIFHLPLSEFLEVRINSGEHKSFNWFSPQEALNLPLIRDQDELIKMFYHL
ncbi:MAG: NUDIX hydrolase [Patescibacteria group bacterium]|jgi:mutator protein MutT